MHDKKPNKIVFLISSLRLGGAERIATTLCNYWASNNHQIVLITLDSSNNDFFPIHDKIIRHSINAYAPSHNLVEKVLAITRRIIHIRKIIILNKPDVVVSFIDKSNMLAILACLFIKIPVVITEHTYPPYFNNNNFFDLMRKTIYKLSAVFVTQTTIVADWAKKFLINSKVMIIPNPLDTNNLSADLKQERHNNILAVGRLCPEKGFDRLINVFKQFESMYPDWKLVIVGDGPERKNLENQLQTLNLQNRVILTGKVASTQIYYSSSKIFVLSSRVEGFPTVLLEAMAHQLPVISFDCACGPADIIENGVNGILVQQDNLDGLSAALQNLMQDTALRDRLATEAVKVRDKYELKNISDQWFKVFNLVQG